MYKILSALIVGAAALQGVAGLAIDPDWVVSLIKRQAPGTPLYYCHDNCGQAVTGSRNTGYCTNTAFIHNYANCIQCSGPDNNNIWQWYGSTLGPKGGACGFPTTPDSGTQPAVGPAMPAGGSCPDAFC